MVQPRRSTGMLHRMLSRTAPAEPDPADYGTCFGLEISLDETPPLPQARTDAPLSWVQRLTSRTKPSR